MMIRSSWVQEPGAVESTNAIGAIAHSRDFKHGRKLFRADYGRANKAK